MSIDYDNDDDDD